MYRPEFHCSKCNVIWKISEAITFMGLCPHDGQVLDLEFITTGYKQCSDQNKSL